MQINLTINIDDKLIERIKSYFTRRNTIAVVFTGIFAVSAMVYAATVTKPWEFNNGDIIDADKINDNFDLLYNTINTLGGNQSVFHTGMIMPYAGSSAPDGWLLCNGDAIPGSSTDPTDPYYELHRLLSDGRTPDLRGRYIIGKFNGGGAIASDDPRYGLNLESWCSSDDLGKSTYSWKRALDLNQMPSHSHGFTYYNHNDVFQQAWVNGSGSAYVVSTKQETSNINRQTNNETTGNSGGTEKIIFIPPSMAMNYIIKI